MNVPRRKATVASTPSSPRRGRPQVISDEKILETARNVFLARGIQATTAEVADRARISEGTIFHRFKSKDALFRAAMRVDPESAATLVEAITPRVGAADLRGALIAMGNRIIELGRIFVPIMMMSWSNPSGDYSFEKLVNRQGFDRPIRGLSVFFEAEMDAGRLARSDVRVLTRGFLGALRDYCMTELVHETDATRPPAAVFVEGLVDLLFRTAHSTRRPPDRSVGTRV